MPLYEYQCEACEHRFEVQQRLSEPPLATCPSCGKDRLEKRIGATSFQLKGGGWYKDLYSSPKPESKKSDSA
jgi:putative FmdB family regulatory protein